MSGVNIYSVSQSSLKMVAGFAASGG